MNLSLRFICSLFFLIELSEQSAIPMWELLAKGDKMNRLFTMFTGQVEEYCYTREISNCEKMFLSHGLTVLSKLDEDKLNQMDPYQRNGDTIVWQALMGPNYKSPNSEKNKFFSPEDRFEEAASSPEGTISGGPVIWRAMPDGRPLPPLHIPADDDIAATTSPIIFKNLIKQTKHFFFSMTRDSPEHEPKNKQTSVVGANWKLWEPELVI